MPRSNPHARERVMDDGKHLDAVASFVTFAGHETSVVSSAGWSCGRALQASTHAIGDQEMLETRRVGALSNAKARRTILDSVPSARAGDGSHPQGWGKSSTARLALPPSVARSSREPERRLTSPSFSRVAKVIRGLRRFVGEDLDHAPAWPAGVSEEPRFRKGRAHDRIVVAEVGRTVTSSWTHAVEGNRGGVTKRNAPGGNTSEAGVITRSMEGALDHQHCNDRHGSSWSGGLGCALADTSSLR